MTPDQIQQMHPTTPKPCVLLNMLRRGKRKLSERLYAKRVAKWKKRTAAQNERAVLSRRGFVAAALAFTVTASISLSTWDDAYAAYLPSTKPAWNALDYGVIGNGSTNDAAAINALFTAANNAGASVWFPGGRTYELGSSSISAPAGLFVVLSATATVRRSADTANWRTDYKSYTGAMVSVGSNCHWIGGVLTNTAFLATSSSSNSVSVALGKTFTIGTGKNIVAGDFLRIESAGTPAAHMEGIAASYVAGVLTFDSQFVGPTAGTFTDWVIYAAAIFQAPIVMHNTSASRVEKVRANGHWYVGFLLEGWNPPAGGALNCVNCIYRDCYAEGIQNRGFYLYGTVTGCVIDRPFVLGQGGTTDYGVNFNPANASGTANSQQRNKVFGANIESIGFQGIAISDLAIDNLVDGAAIISVLSSAGVGLLVQKANNQVPQYNTVANSSVSSAVGSGIAFLGVVAAVAQSCMVRTCGVGLQIITSAGSNCFECAGYDVQITNCTLGVSIGAGSQNTTVSGRSYANTSNISDAGTATNVANLRLV